MHGMQPGYDDGAVAGVERQGHVPSWDARLQLVLPEARQRESRAGADDSRDGRVAGHR